MNTCICIILEERETQQRNEVGDCERSKHEAKEEEGRKKLTVLW
jgi:hypothetical protein